MLSCPKSFDSGGVTPRGNVYITVQKLLSMILFLFGLFRIYLQDILSKVALNVQFPTEDQSHITNNSFYGEQHHVF
jgi:hypothetical protein